MICEIRWGYAVKRICSDAPNPNSYQAMHRTPIHSEAPTGYCHTGFVCEVLCTRAEGSIVTLFYCSIVYIASYCRLAVSPIATKELLASATRRQLSRLLFALRGVPDGLERVYKGWQQAHR